VKSGRESPSPDSSRGKTDDKTRSFADAAEDVDHAAVNIGDSFGDQALENVPKAFHPDAFRIIPEGVSAYPGGYKPGVNDR
jgi:hypothetical protein